MSGAEGPNATGNNNDTSRFVEVIAAQDQISRAVQVFALVQLAGLVAGCFVLAVSARQWLRCGRLEPAQTFLSWQAAAHLALALLSLSGLPRPQPLNTGPAGCAALSFFVNVFYLHTQFSPALAAGLSRAARPLGGSASAAAGLTLAVMVSALLAGLLALPPRHPFPGARYNCHPDPLEAGLGYVLTKFCLGFAAPVLTLAGLTCWQAGRGGRRGLEERPGSDSGSGPGPGTALVVTVTLTFLCRLVYNAFLLCRPLYRARDPHFEHRAELLVTVAEMVMFGGSCLALVLTAALCSLHRGRALAILRRAGKLCRTTSTETV